jgi:hypothetical protein
MHDLIGDSSTRLPKKSGTSTEQSKDLVRRLAYETVNQRNLNVFNWVAAGAFARVALLPYRRVS